MFRGLRWIAQLPGWGEPDTARSREIGPTLARHDNVIYVERWRRPAVPASLPFVRRLGLRMRELRTRRAAHRTDGSVEAGS